MANPAPSMPTKIGAEIIGTFLLVFLGCGAVHSAVLTNSLSGLYQVGIVWGVAIMMAVFTVGRVSGAHINPAITIALATWKKFKWAEVPGYIFGQMFGAFLAAAALFVIYQDDLLAKEADNGVQRGQEESIITAMCYGEYFPNPGGLAQESGTDPDHEQFAAAFGGWKQKNILLAAIIAEILGTAILGFVVVGVTDPENSGSPGQFAPAIIGLTVAVLICVIAPLTQACFNPARDWGPRLFAYVGGWGSAAIPGPNGMAILAVYLVAPIVGALAGMGIYVGLFNRREEA